MLSTLSSLPSWAVTLILSHLEFVAGYAVCVILPIPWINRFILDLWLKLYQGSSVTPSNS